MKMKSVISVILFIFLRCHLGCAINCYSCFGDCEGNTTKACAQGEHCMTSEIYSDGRLQQRQFDCLNAQFCNHTQNLSLMVQKCCDKDLCNNPRAASVTAPKPDNAGDTSRDTILQCYTCDTPCILKSTTTCRAQELCLTKSWKLLGVDYHKRGCGNTTVCNTETQGTTLGTNFLVKNQCCKTNLCNSAIHLEVPAVVILAAIVAVWMSKLS